MELIKKEQENLKNEYLSNQSQVQNIEIKIKDPIGDIS
jgi:hypothetical protein